MWQHLAQAQRVHMACHTDAAARVAPQLGLAAGHVRSVGQQGRCGVAAHAVFAHGGQQGAVARQQAQRVVGDAAARPEQDHGNRLVRDLVDARRQAVLATQKVQAAVDHAQLTTREPQQAVAVGVGDAGLFQPEAALEHDCQPARCSSNMPKP